MKGIIVNQVVNHAYLIKAVALFPGLSRREISRQCRAFTRFGRSCGSGDIFVTHGTFSLGHMFETYQGEVVLGDVIVSTAARYTCNGRRIIYRAWYNGYWLVDIMGLDPFYELVNGRITLTEGFRMWNGTYGRQVTYCYSLESRTYRFPASAGWTRSNVPSFDLIDGFYHDRVDLPPGVTLYASEAVRLTSISATKGRILAKMTTDAKAASAAYLYPEVFNPVWGRYQLASHHSSPLGEASWVGDVWSLTSLPYLYDAMSQAAVSCYRNLPESQVNMIANIIDVCGLIKSASRGLAVASENIISDSYLSYRYSYSTTKSDIMEMASLFKRLLKLLSVTFTQHGSFTKVYKYYDVDGTEHTAQVTARVSATFLSSDFVNLPVSRKIDQMGLRLNAYNAWDLVPFSFIVDWFLPVQDFLATADQVYRNNRVNYHSSGWTTSVEVKFEDGEGTWCNYARRFNYAPELRVTSAISGVAEVSSVAWYYHIADALAIFLK